MKTMLFMIAASFAISSAAMAGNPDTATGTDWSGFYLGASFGTRTAGNMEYVSGGPTISYPSLEPGQTYGAFAGYNFQRNNLVYGGELAYSAVNRPGFGAVG